ncbi:hypothetical protein D3C76_1328260 [compost metagenome]
MPHTLIKALLMLCRAELPQRLDGQVCMATGGVIDGHMQLEIVAVNAQLSQFIRGDQQMQGWLLIAQVVTQYFGQKRITVLPQSQLQGALQIAAVIQLWQIQAAKPAQ